MPESSLPPPEPPATPHPTPRAKLAAAARLLANLDSAATGGQPALPLEVLPQMALARGRVHELTGPARRTLAAVAAGAAQAEGPVLWLRPNWRPGGLCPQGLSSMMPDPGALILAHCSRAVDVLWGAEEALRAGCVALVVAEVAEAPDLRQVRRLHLAAAEGVARNRAAGRMAPAPLGLLLAFETATSQLAGIESRWALHPLPAGMRPMQDTPMHGDALGGALARGGPGTGPQWRLQRLLARNAPPCDWTLDVARIHARGHATRPAEGPKDSLVLAGQ